MEPTYFADRWVRLMAGLCTDAIWESGGCACSLDEIPISEQLKVEIEAWADWYDRDCEDGMPDPRSFERTTFAAHGLVLAHRLKNELPAWTVVYFDELRANTMPCGADRSYFEYEIEPVPPL